MNTSLASECAQQLLLRLPELRWKLPYWPRNYNSLIPEGVFQKCDDWQPEHAITEIQNHIFQLLKLPEHSLKAYYLSQKILKQIDILVYVSQKMPEHFIYPIEKNALTRTAYLEKLQEQIDILDWQKKALERNLSLCAYPELMNVEIDKAQTQLSQLQSLLSKA